MRLLKSGSENLCLLSLQGQQRHNSDKSSDSTVEPTNNLASSTQCQSWAQAAYSSPIALNCRLPMEHERGRPVVQRRGPQLLGRWPGVGRRSEEHTSELQSRQYLVCRLLLEKKKPHSHLCAPSCLHPSLYHCC